MQALDHAHWDGIDQTHPWPVAQSRDGLFNALRNPNSLLHPASREQKVQVT